MNSISRITAVLLCLNIAVLCFSFESQIYCAQHGVKLQSAGRRCLPERKILHRYDQDVSQSAQHKKHHFSRSAPKKLVINQKKYGVFGLSEIAKQMYQKRSGQRKCLETYLKRDDPILVDIVIELGEKANGEFSSLKVIKIPSGHSWSVKNFEGIETVDETYATWQ